MWDAWYIVVWSMATDTKGFKEEGVSTAIETSSRVQFSKEVIRASMEVHTYSSKDREQAMRRELKTTKTMRQVKADILWQQDRTDTEEEPHG